MASLPLSASVAPDEAKRIDEAILTWTVHLLRRHPARLPQLGVILLGIFALGLCVFHSFWLALLPVFATFLSLSEFLFPIRYTLTQHSASARHGFTMLEMPWADVRRAYLTDDGIKLSPLRARNSRFEALRGILLRFDGANQDTVIAAVQRLRAEDKARG